MTPETKNKIVYGVIAAALIAIFLWGRSCGINSVLKTVGRDTIVTVRVDTVETNPEPDTIIQTVIKTRVVDGETIFDTLYIDTTFAVAPTDTLKELTRLQEVEKKYNQKVFYKDSAEGSNWKAVVSDQVYQNRLQKPRQWVITKKDSLIEERTVLKPPQKIVVFMTGALMGKPKDPFYGAGAGLTLKTPGDHLYGVKAKWIPGYGWVYEAEVGIPIRLFKKK